MSALMASSPSSAPVRGAASPPARALTRLCGLGTAVPRHSAGQRQICRFLTRVTGIDSLKKLYAASGIARRHSVLADYGENDPRDFAFFPKNWALEPFPSTAARMAVYERCSVELAESAARRALAESGVPARRVTHLIVATCTGFFAPGPDIALIERLGLPGDVRRAVIGFMGCYAGFNGLRAADDIVRADPGAVVLQICVELCSLHFQKRPRPDLQVANALFADGASAAVYAAAAPSEGPGLADVLASHGRIAPGTIDQMSWRIGDTGFEMSLDRRVPRSLKRHAPIFVEELLRRAGQSASAAAGWAVHPGGRKIVEEVRDALGLSEEDVASSFEILRDYGNMSSPTIFFVLDRELRRRRGCVVAMGFGPGLTMEGAVLRTP